MQAIVLTRTGNAVPGSGERVDGFGAVASRTRMVSVS